MLQNCHTYNSTTGLEHNGFSIANCPFTQNETEGFAYMVRHEACGHGFGYLEDEYITSSSPSPSIKDIEYYTQRYEKFGRNANIDFTNNLKNIRWAHFINDSRYYNEKLGAYEGAVWTKGVYRATETSIMSIDYSGLFNAPSREAIYKRAMKLAYGDSWTYDYEELMNTFTIYKKAKVLNNKGAKFIGLHLEGPYFSPSQCGAQDPNYLKKPCPKEYNHFINISQDIVRWSVAPELEGAIEMGEELQRQHILPSIAHTDATYEEVEKANKAGYTHITHLYSAMSSVTRRNAFRHAGVVEAAYLIDDITVEIIADGIHLPKPLLQFVYKFKGPDKTALCTDAMRGAGMPDGESILGSLTNGQKVIIEDGVAKMPDRSAFAGSVATTDRLVRTMVQLAGIPLTDAIRMMTLTPARILHIDSSKGSLEAGKDADIIIFDNQINVINTISEGHVIYSK
jgi:N-acetylglucosamine-6-phosphate deacetylase